MRLYDTPLTREQIKYEADMIRGNINRICVSDDPVEIVAMIGFMNERINVIAQSRILEIMKKAGESNEGTY